MLKLLRLEFQKIKVFKDGLVLDLTASNRVVHGENVFFLDKAICTQNVIALAGINASGKTTALRLIEMAILIISDNKSLDQLGETAELFCDDSVMIVDFFLNNGFFRLVSCFGRDSKGFLYFKDEVIFKKRKIGSKSNRFDYRDDEVVASRKDFTGSVFSVLKDNDSIVVSVTKNDSCVHLNTLSFTNFNFFISEGNINPLYLALLDKSIESISVVKGQMDIKFKNSGEKKDLSSPLVAEEYVSSGTIRGSQLLDMAHVVLSDGGYLIVDEIENHLNKKLVQLLIELFQNNEVNSAGAVLIFS